MASDGRWLRNLLEDLESDGVYAGYKYDPKNVDFNTRLLVAYYENRLQAGSEWKGLVPTIPQDRLEHILLNRGYALVPKEKIADPDGLEEPNYYANAGNLGGRGDAYNFPTLGLVSIPYLSYNKQLRLKKDVLLLRNDTNMLGSRYLIEKAVRTMTETELTMHTINILSRASLLFTATNEQDKETVEEFINRLVDGDLSVIYNSKPSIKGLDQKIEVQPGATMNAQILNTLTGFNQYNKGSLFNEFGYNANWNAKHENLTETEVMLNDDCLMSLVDDMAYWREDAAEQLSDLFGTEVTWNFKGVLKRNEEEIDKEIEMAEQPPLQEQEQEKQQTEEEVSEDEKKETTET